MSELQTIDKETVTFLNIGCGGMEIERQLITELIKKEIKKNIIFIGVEISRTISKIAFSNLNSLVESGWVEMKELTELDDRALSELQSQVNPRKYLARIFNKDALKLKEQLSSGSFDLVYHSMMKHHLGEEDKKTLDELIKYLAPRAIEYDDFYSFPLLILPSIFTWKSPSLLNGTILSLLRDPSKKAVLSEHEGWRIKIYPFMGYYLRIYDTSSMN